MLSLWMKNPVGEEEPLKSDSVRLNATVSELKPEDIPLAPDVDLDAIKDGDDSPMEIVVEVPVGKSKRGWNYQEGSLKAIVNHVQKHTLNGFLGHQTEEEVSNRFVEPVTHWVGAVYDEQNKVAYFRGVVDKDADKLKRWIKTKRIKQVSIFGYPKISKKVSGEVDVIDYRPLSIDWTPLDRSGMPTRIVAIGEMDEINQIIGGNETMTWKELVEKLRAMLQSEEVTLSQIVAALGVDVKQLAGEMESDWVNGLNGDSTRLKSLEQILQGVSGEMEVDELAKQAVEALQAKRQADRNAVISEVIKEKVTGEMAQGLVLKMINPSEDATKEQIAGEVEELLKDETVKSALSAHFVSSTPIVGEMNNPNNPNASKYTKTRNSSI
ncbi:hypothetical protein AJ85_05690 [Alkalihalobacillus alcalophilus ATCC 27647 = CGMCC 1.3604]|uniref:Transcriptional regulator n=1 Tax=Alkalihalobacillus alcalophilus ATCC 27647 = CGMCC 1.3604 TaxID=1218173 RepID=A0A094XDK9_ALKAL|nr:hypothetical protein [Alkalihalobacillus alcalophilus]YP_009276834.1 hypothetical protein BH791_gp28 [Bacillus phage BalMu-1]AJA42406.1 hypothetical protein BalMu1_B28 [Bacillus phage BalMu-1]AJA42462.1 hypothetical protein BalMu1_A28 [Bacillus phage BalMu-1]KGA96860.1 transcriptional regulator [Alkalihalobacillus alcalophilus ATCC 27647 = CGMCC 1.3604]MED1561149.1 transcriptional regulator [Alkalihalobacillus alcalophilus]THG91315.1 hypothetical protein AJ85_05690 [Alkalihalobacillus alca